MMPCRTPVPAVLHLLPILAALAGPGSATALVIDATWIGGADVWNDAGNWDTGVVPNNGADTYNVFIDGGATGSDSTVTLDVDVRIDDLSVDAGDLLIVSNARELTVTGTTLLNDGTIRLDSTGGPTELRVAGATLSGNGEITLSEAPSLIGDNQLEGDGAGSTLTVASGSVLVFRTGNLAFGGNGLEVTNQGAIHASDGATVRVHGSDFLNSGASFQADDLSSFAVDSGARILGGTLSSQGSGEFRAGNGGTPFGILEGVHLTGRVRLANVEDLTLAGAIVNDGEIAVESEGGATQLRISDTTPTSLDGVGSIRFSSGVSLFGDNEVEGSGVGSSLSVSAGAIQTFVGGDGSVGGGSLELTNDGTLEADGGTTVRFFDVPVTNNGTIVVKDASILQVDSGAVITGGILSTEGTGAFQAGIGAAPFGALDGVQLTGRVELPNTRDLTLAGAITNDGEIALQSDGGITQLRISDLTPTSLQGTGTLSFSDAPSFFGDNEVEGSGPGSSLTIVAGATQSLSGGRASVGGGSLTLDNDGTLEAVGGTTLRFFDVPVSNDTGEIRVGDGSILHVDSGASITGGTLHTEGSGSFRGSISSAPFGVLDGVTNTGRVELQNGEDLVLAGDIVNDGSFALASTGGSTQLQISGAVDVSGSGAFEMSDTPTPFGNNELEEASAGATLTLGAGQTLRGVGTVGVALETAGSIEPGAEIGQLNVTRDLTLTANAVLRIEMDGVAQGSEYDFVTVTSGADVELAGSFFPVLTESFALDVTPADVFEVLHVSGGGSISGAFVNAASGARVLGPGGASFVIEYGPTSSGDPNKIVLSDFAKVVPGPARVWQFDGIAQGGSIDFTVSGVPLSVPTTAGLTADEVAELVADAIRNDPILFSIPISANHSRNFVFTDGDVGAVTISDPGLTHTSVPTVPALPWPALVVLGALMLLAAGARRRSRVG